MSFENSEVGSYAGSYWEYTHRSGGNSPRSDKAGSPPRYTQWNNYEFDKRSYLGWMAWLSRNPPPNLGNHYRDSAYNCGLKVGFTITRHPDNTRLLADMVNKYRQSDFNLGIAAIEGKESASMVVDRLQSLLFAARSLRKGNLGGATRHLYAVPRSHRKKAARKLSQGDVSGSWLELHLGWAPMISDIYAASELIKPMKARNLLKTQRRPGSISVTGGGGVAPSDTRWQYHSRLVVEILSEPTWYQRLGLTNPADIVWEAVPFSFVVDYFVPIGRFISSLEAPFINVGRMFTQTYYEVNVLHRAYAKGEMISPNVWLNQSVATTNHRYRKFNRTLTSVPALMATRKLSWNLPTKLVQIGNMAALLHQALLGLKPRHAVSG